MQSTITNPRKKGLFRLQPLTSRSASYQRQMRAADLFLLTGMFFFFTLNIYPLLKAFQISFYDWSLSPNQASQFVGMGNYLRAFSDPVVWRALHRPVGYRTRSRSG